MHLENALCRRKKRSSACSSVFTASVQSLMKNRLKVLVDVDKPKFAWAQNLPVITKRLYPKTLFICFSWRPILCQGQTTLSKLLQTVIIFRKLTSFRDFVSIPCLWSSFVTSLTILPPTVTPQRLSRSENSLVIKLVRKHPNIILNRTFS